MLLLVVTKVITLIASIVIEAQKNFKMNIVNYLMVSQESIRILSLELNTEVKPIFCRQRAKPFAYITAVEEKLNKLEEAGIIKLNDACQWGKPLVSVLTPNGSSRLCADYKITVNKFIKDIHYPFPPIKELFPAVQGDN